MCDICVAKGSLSQEEYEAARAAGDKSVIPLMERVLNGEDPEALLDEVFGSISRIAEQN